MGVVEALEGKLEDYRLQYPEESPTVDVFIDFVSRNLLTSFDRSLNEGHITVSCWLLNQQQTKVLLTHHRKLNCWIQLGGHADGETDPKKVALTEAREESGIESFEFLLDGRLFDIDRHAIPARKNEPEHFHYDLRYAMRTTETDEYVVSAESHDLCWVDVARLADYTTDKSVIRMARKWLMLN